MFAFFWLAQSDAFVIVHVHSNCCQCALLSEFDLIFSFNFLFLLVLGLGLKQLVFDVFEEASFLFLGVRGRIQIFDGCGNTLVV